LRNGSNAVQIVDGGFTTVNRTKARKETPHMPSQCVRKNKQPMIGVRCSSSLFTIVKRVKIKYLFISHFYPEVSATYIEISLLDQLKLSSLTCTRLKTKFRMYMLLFTYQLMSKISPQLTIWEYGPMAA
jgi:hypothetical protein